MLGATRASALKLSPPFRVVYCETHSLKSRRPRSLRRLLMSAAAARSPRREVGAKDGGVITLQEWQGWGPVSPFPATVKQIVEDLKVLVLKTDSDMEFGGNGSKLQDKKHRVTYEALDDSEKKFRFFAA